MQHKLPKPAFEIGDNVRVVGKYACEWADDENLRICEIRYSREWRSYSYGFLDNGNYIFDGWEDVDLQLRTPKGTGGL